MQDHRERIEKDDLDVEEDEQHRRQVEADGEALRSRRARRDAGLERDRPGPHRRFGRVANTKLAMIIVEGITRAKNP